MFAEATRFFITEDGSFITNEHVAGNGAQVRLVVLLRQACVVRKRGEFAGAQGERGVEAARG